MAIAMILSLLPVMASAATPTTLYMKPNSNWTKDGARFAAYFFGNGEKWVSMTDTDGDGLYEVAVPSGYPKVIFCRMNGSTTANNWNNKWNQTGDLTIPTDGKNCFTVPSGSWDGATTGWGTYTPVVVPEWESPIIDGDSVTFNYWTSDDTVTSVVVAGNMNGWSTTANPMTKGEDGIWTTTISGLTNNVYQYKFVVGTDGWINDPKNTGALVDGNNTFEITDGVVPTEPIRNVTVHYRNTKAWDGTVNAYAWDYESSVFYTAGFPGDEMTLEAEHANWYTVVVALPVSATTMNIQFSSGSNKGDVLAIADIPADADSEYWFDDLTSTEFVTEAPESWADGTVELPKCPETVYFLPNFNWVGGDARFAAYFFNAASENAWVDMSSLGNGVYAAAVPEGMTSVIFCRMNPEFADNAWSNDTEARVWNQSVDLALPTDGTDLYAVAQNIWGADDWKGEWKTYVEASAFESPVVDGNSVTFNYWHLGASSVSVHGSMDNWGEGYAMTKGEDGVWSVTINDLANGVYQYKLVVDDCWIIDPANGNIQTEADGNQNSQFNIGTPVAEIYGVGEYFTFLEAYAVAVDSDAGYSIVLLADVTVDGLAVDKELYLDLNGHNATFTNTTGEGTIWAQDSATVDPATTQWGTLITNANYDCLGGYVMLPEAEGHSFHSFEVNITSISLKPADDALGFKAQLVGDSAVQAAVTGFGFDMSVAGGQTKTYTKAGAPTNGEFSLRLKNILANNGGEMAITGSAFVIFDNQSYYSDEQTTTMKETLQAVDAAWSGYTDEQQKAVRTLVNAYSDVTDQWNLDNINIVIDIPLP